MVEPGIDIITSTHGMLNIGRKLLIEETKYVWCIIKQTKKQMTFSAKYSKTGEVMAVNLALITIVTAPDSSYFQPVKKLSEI